MSLFKKKNGLSTPSKTSAEENEPISDADFVYAGLGDASREQPFQTKPSTFFKDAMKRFVKNRSSVVAAGILFVLIAMAIIVPLADQNNISTPVDSIKYLPPKWFDVNNAGILDGTARINNAPLDPSTKELPSDGTYKNEGVISDIDITETYNNDASESVINYGTGGSLVVTSLSDGENNGILSQPVTLSVSEETYFTVNLDSEATAASSPSFDLVFETSFDGTTQKNVLGTYSSGAVLSGSEANSIITASPHYVAAGSPSSYSGRLGILFHAGNDDKAIYVTSVTARLPEGSSTDLSLATFDDATKAYVAFHEKKTTDGSASGPKSYFELASTTSKMGINRSVVYYGSFRYDYYKAAFGSTTMKIDDKLVEEFVSMGYMTYQWTGYGENIAPGDFEILNDQYCPIRKVISQTWKHTSFGADTKELNCEVSLYRWDYFKGYIGKCAMPKYFFGTDNHGADFFKLAFSGLMTSLGLGFLASVINIAIGIIWGSLSGYFGGWVDLIMERVTEILGGMPWIVLMTLIILLLGSNFWTFLLALCLTGWMGVAGTTRSQFYRFKGREYVLASRTLGAGDMRLIFKHILPNGIGTIITGAVLMIPSVIFTEANISYLLPNTLSFTGTSFGVTLSSAQSEIGTHPYLIVTVSIVMILIMISFNLFGNGLRDAFNPSLKGTED